MEDGYENNLSFEFFSFEKNNFNYYKIYNKLLKIYTGGATS